MRRMLVLIVALLTVAAVPATAAPPAAGGSGASPYPSSIPLPDGFFPEGITISDRTAYVGSLVDGAIQQQDLRTGTSTPFAASPGQDKIAVGMDVDDRGRLWVAGGGPGLAPTVEAGFRVYDSATGDLLLDVPLRQAGFVNDVIVTRDAAWFTDSFAPTLIRVPIARDGTIGVAEYVALAGDWEQAAGFNANGIAATPDGRQLIVAQSTAPAGAGAALYRVPADTTADALDAVRIRFDGTLAGADGLVLIGRTLYSVAGGSGVVKLRLSRELTAARIVDTLAVPDAISPTTADVYGARLYVVDAKFPLFADPTVPFQTTVIRR